MLIRLYVVLVDKPLAVIRNLILILGHVTQVHQDNFCLLRTIG